MTPFERMRQELTDWSRPGPLAPSVLLQLNEPLRGTLKQVMRQGSITFGELSERLALTTSETETIADLLVTCGFLKTTEEDAAGVVTYRLQHTRTHRPRSPIAIWNALLDDEDGSGDDGKE